MKTVFALLALTLATANAGNIMDLITEQSVGGKIVEITFDGKYLNVKLLEWDK